MASFSAKRIQDAARGAGYRPEVYEKAARLLDYLAAVDEHPHLKSRLTLRGGTAINLFMADAPRLSVDADLNYIGAEDAKAMIADRPIVEKALRDVGKNLGYEWRTMKKPYALDQFGLMYQNVYGQKDTLKVETNYLMRVPFIPPERRGAKTLLDDVKCQFTLAGADEVYAGKVKALVERCAPRDLFDANRLIQEGLLRTDPRRRRLIVAHLAMVSTANLDVRSATTAKVAWPDERTLRGELLPMLRTDAVVEPARMRARVEPLLDELFRYGAPEAAFLRDVAAGTVNGKTLCPDDPGLAGRIDRHPAIRWRAQHPSAPEGA